MNVESMQFGFETVRWLVVTAIGIYAWFIGRQSASAEAEIQQIPKHQDFHELALRVERLDVSIKSVHQHLAEMRASVRRIEDWLMNDGK